MWIMDIFLHWLCKRGCPKSIHVHGCNSCIVLGANSCLTCVHYSFLTLSLCVSLSCFLFFIVVVWSHHVGNSHTRPDALSRGGKQRDLWLLKTRKPSQTTSRLFGLYVSFHLFKVLLRKTIYCIFVYVYIQYIYICVCIYFYVFFV